jgi:hypothetical protein
VKIEFHQILAAPTCRDYNNLTFLEKRCELISMEKNVSFNKRKRDKVALETTLTEPIFSSFATSLSAFLSSKKYPCPLWRGWIKTFRCQRRNDAQSGIITTGSYKLPLSST